MLNDLRKSITDDQRNSMMYLIQLHCFTSNDVNQSEKVRIYLINIIYLVLFLDDVKKLFDQRNDKYAVMCAQHDYTPKEGVKMDGKAQTIYPRKNWSSMMLINCGHPSNLNLTDQLVNDEYKTGAYFHRFSWLQDREIGKLSHEWNWLVGWYKEPEDGTPSALHYTEGGPWFKEYYNCEYNKEWLDVERTILQDRIQKYEKNENERAIRPVTANVMSVSDSKKKLIDDIIKISIDPQQKYYKS